MKMYYMRGATAYEFQWGRVWVRWCHLSGPYWKFKPWRRFSVTLIKEYDL